MKTIEKNQLWRIPLVVSGFVALIYGIIYLCQGYIPVTDKLVLFNKQEYVFWNLPMVFNLPFPISRLWDIPLSFIFTFAFIRLRISYIQTKNEDLKPGLAIGLVAGLITGLVVGLAASLGFGLAIGLGFGLGFGLAIGLGFSLIIDLAFGLVFGLGFVTKILLS